MVILKNFFFLFMLIGCAKIGYIAEQSVGQLGLQNRGIENEKALKGHRLSPEEKEKIRLIQKYKRYFYKYWSKKESNLYNKTVILNQDAVTYLVVSSPFYKISPVKECFPIVGCFPYLGFFKKESALAYKRKQEKKGLETMLRPVYAYSTLTNFDDHILSSFFYYDEFSLAELIFHELFHTIFFIKNEVDLNENLANFFGKMMALEYFSGEKLEKFQNRIKNEEKRRKVREKMVFYVKNLSKILIKQAPKNKIEASKVREKYFKDQIIPFFEDFCKKIKISTKKCFPLKKVFNNAEMAGMMTYEKKLKDIEDMYLKSDKSLKKLFKMIENKYSDFEKSGEKDFSRFLFH